MLRKGLRSACAIALLTCLMGASGSAQTYDKRTVFTFSGPVALPGVTLPAGQYLFRLADPASSRKVVQVLSADGKTPYGMFFSLPAERFEPASTPEVQFMGTASGMPAAINAWWYPGERSGYYSPRAGTTERGVPNGIRGSVDCSVERLYAPLPDSAVILSTNAAGRVRDRLWRGRW
jgi:hypothetical protein